MQVSHDAIFFSENSSIFIALWTLCIVFNCRTSSKNAYKNIGKNGRVRNTNFSFIKAIVANLLTPTFTEIWKRTPAANSQQSV